MSLRNGLRSMAPGSELRAFRGVVALVLLLPLLGGLTGAFGGLEGMAWLLRVDSPIVVPAPLRNNLRAVCCAFASWVPLTVWSLAALRERGGAFRIVVGSGFVAGLARLTGWRVEGDPGAVATTILALELAGMPILLFWHARLARLGARAPTGSCASRHSATAPVP